MSPVDFKKWPCPPVEFRGQGPLKRLLRKDKVVGSNPAASRKTKIGHWEGPPAQKVPQWSTRI